MKRASAGLRGAAEASRKAISLLTNSLQLLRDDPHIPEPVRPFSKYIESAIRVLEGIESGSGSFVVDRLDESLTRLRHILHAMQEPTELVPMLGQATEAIARSLVLLHPAHESLVRAEAEHSSLSLDHEQQHGPAILHDDRRAFERVPMRTAIGFQNRTSFYTGFSGDLSDGGLFIASNHLLPVGTELTLSLVLPDGKQMTTRARVSWVRDEDCDQGSRGMGVAFRKLEEDQADAVVAFVEERPS